MLFYASVFAAFQTAKRNKRKELFLFIPFFTVLSKKSNDLFTIRTDVCIIEVDIVEVKMVAHIFHNGDKAYIIDNVRFLREVIVLKVTRDLCIIWYVDNGAVIRIRPSRLFETEKEALNYMPPDARPKKSSHWDYELHH